jgi:MFS family permease
MDTTDAPSTRGHPGGNYRWVICTLLFFSVAVNYIDRLVIGILKRPLSDSLGWNDADYGHIAAAFSFAYAFGYLFGGRLMDRWGVKKGLPIFVFVWSLAAIAHGLVGFVGVEEQFRLNYPWFSFAEKGVIWLTLSMPMTAAGFMLARIALGLSEGGNFPGAIKAVAEWYPVKERALATGLFNAGTNVGAILCPIGVPWLFSHLGWEATFYITGASGLIWVAAWWWIYETPEKHKRLSAAELQYIKEGQQLAEEKPVKVSWISLLGYRAVWAYVLAGILSGPAWGFYQFFLPDFLDKSFGSPTLSARDFEFPRLIAELRQPDDSVSFYLGERLSPATRAALSGESPSRPSPELQKALLTDFNRIVDGPSWFEEARFKDVQLRPETKVLISRQPEGPKLRQLNRMLIEDAYPNALKPMLSLQAIGGWTGAFFAIAAVGGVLGGWLAGKLMSRGWSVNAARKVSLLACALAVVPVFFAPFAPSVGMAVLIIGIAGSAHQGWSANLFSVVSDTMPKEAISSVVGFGGFVSYFTGGFVNEFTGMILQKTGSYVYVFAYFSGMYVLSLLLIQLLVPRIGKVQMRS